MDVERTLWVMDSRNNAKLQWGHVLLDVERRDGLGAIDIDRDASMGPRPVGRGELPVDLQHRLDKPASMGPRPVGRGELKTIRRIEAGLRLQWGHVLLDVESA